MQGAHDDGMQRFAPGVLLSLLLGCSGESLAVYAPKDQPEVLQTNADSNVHRLQVGTSAIVKATIIHPEIEGSTAIQVDELVVDDPSLVTVIPLPHEQWELRGIGIGETVLRAKNDGDVRASLPIKVIP